MQVKIYTPRFLTIDLRKVAEKAFTPKELAALAVEEWVTDAVDDWTNSLMDSLEEVHGFEHLLCDFIEENYSRKA